MVLTLLVPLVADELFPFSCAPMFCDAPQQYCRYRVRGPDGHELDLTAFGLQRNYWGNPPVGMGYYPPPTLDEFGKTCPPERVRGEVKLRLARLGLPWVEVTQEVVGDVDGRTVGVVQSQTWRIER